MKTTRKSLLLFFFCVLLQALPAFGQTVSEKKEIAVFNLSYYDWSLPGGILGVIDEQIRSVFINMGRFEVLGLTQRLSNKNVNEFIEKIKEFKEKNAKIPEKVLMGQEAFTEKDWNRLVGAFLVVIPSVSFYNTETLKDGSYRVKIQTSFTFINVEQGRASAQFFVETTGSDKNLNNAVKSAVDGIPSMLTYEIRKVPEFQIKSGVVQVMGRDVIFELGSNMGIQIGDEYALISYRNVAGFQAVDETGLLIVKEVQDRFSVGQIIYSDKRPVVGDQLREIPRSGVEAMLYGGAFFVDNYDMSYMPLLGVKAVPSRGYFSTRPIVGVELPFSVATAALALFDIIPLNIYLGAELTNLYAGRVQIAPALVGVVGIAYLGDTAKKTFNTDQDYFVTHVGGRAFVSLSVLISRDTKITVDGGYAAMFGVASALIDVNDKSYFATKTGPFVNVGLTFK